MMNIFEYHLTYEPNLSRLLRMNGLSNIQIEMRSPNFFLSASNVITKTLPIEVRYCSRVIWYSYEYDIYMKRNENWIMVVNAARNPYHGGGIGPGASSSSSSSYSGGVPPSAQLAPPPPAPPAPAPVVPPVIYPPYG